MKQSNEKIFVIYTTRDEYVTKNVLNKICNELKIFGDVFIDLIHNNSENKQEYVIEKLYECTSIVIVDTPNLESSEWAKLEISIAQKERKRIFGYYKLKFRNNNPELVFTKNI